MTGQGILLVGMMTEAVVTPFLSDRDLALQNVRYVLIAAGGLQRGLPPAARRLHPEPGPAGPRARRSTLLERIVHDTPASRHTGAAARGDRRRDVRADEAAARRRARASTASWRVPPVEGYDNPAIALLEEGETR